MNTGQMVVSLRDAIRFAEKAQSQVEAYVDATQRISIRQFEAANAKAECRKALREAIERLELAVLSLDS